MSDTVNWLFVDLNSYFASVEQQIHPEWRGRPLAVVPMLAETTSCIAVSYEAKRKGVKTGTSVRDAKKLCPGIIFCAAHHNHYVEYHEKIVEAVESCLPITSVMSIDEMACRLTGRDQKIENAIALGHEVKAKILKVGSQLYSSVGLAPNRFLAKVAADMQKPDGLTIIKKSELPEALFKLKPNDLPGIGQQMNNRLSAQGIKTIQQLLSLDSLQMKKIWGGIGGERFYRWLKGDDFNVDYEANKSIGHSHVLPPELRNEKGAYAVAQKLLHKAAIRLRKVPAWAPSMYVSVRFLNGEKWSEDVNMLECQDTLTLQEVLQKMWKKKPRGAPLKVSVRLYNLIPDQERTFSFFENPKRIQLSKAMDALNVKYGKNTVYLGGVHEVLTSAPTRIAFSSIPDLSI